MTHDKTPNAETLAAIAEADDLIRTGPRRFKTIEALFEHLGAPEPDPNLADFTGVQAILHKEMDETEFLLRGNNRARLDASIANLGPTGEAITTAKEHARWAAKGAERFGVEGSYEGKLYRVSVGPIDSGTEEELQAYLDELKKLLEEPDASPFVLTKMGRIEDLTEEDLEGFEFLPVDSDAKDVALLARVYLEMSPADRAALRDDAPLFSPAVRGWLEKQEAPDA